MSRATAPEQCVILLEDSGGLADLLWQARRFGFRRVLVLTDDARAAAETVAGSGPAEGLDVEISAFSGMADACEALNQAADRLDPRFLLLDGGPIFDCNWLDLQALSLARPEAKVCMGLAGHAAGCGRARVALDGERVTGLGGEAQAGDLVSGGVYLVDRSVLESLPAGGGFEQAGLPQPIAQGLVAGRRQAGDFAGAAGLAARARGAVFFDRDGVLNVDHGYTHRWDQFEWTDGAIAAVKAVNDRNLFAFVVTNQSGVARGYYDEAAIGTLHGRMQSALRGHGAHIDDIRYCPHHPDGTARGYAKACDWRKPGPGMILDLAAHWPVDLAASFLVGDKPSDMQAAAAAGVRGAMFDAGRLDRLVDAQLAHASAPARPA